MLQHVILSFNEEHIFLRSSSQQCDLMFIPSMHDRETTMATNRRCCVHINAAFVYLCIEKKITFDIIVCADGLLVDRPLPVAPVGVVHPRGV